MSDPHSVAVTLAASPVFPVSFDGNPVLFGMALFSRSLVMSLGAATFVRMRSRTRAEGITPASPIYYHRLVVCCFLWGAMLGSAADVIPWLCWNEVRPSTMVWVLTFAQLCNSVTIVPFLMALFVPFWMFWLRTQGFISPGGGLRLQSTGLQDIRVTWASVRVPLQLLGWCALGSAGVSLGKWVAWHAAHAAV